MEKHFPATFSEHIKHFVKPDRLVYPVWVAGARFDMNEYQVCDLQERIQKQQLNYVLDGIQFRKKGHNNIITFCEVGLPVADGILMLTP